MDYRAIGDTDLHPSVLGLGTSRLTSVSSGLPRRQALALIAAAADQGINFIDTADIYGQGDSEAIIGEAIKGARDRFILATKIGYRFSERSGLFIKAMPLLKRALRPFKHARRLVATVRNNALTANIIKQDFSPSYLATAIDNSLRRLRTDYVDIVYLHDVASGFEESEGLFEALSTIQRSGKVRYFGISAEQDDALKIACSNQTLRVVQTDLHPLRPRSMFASIEAAGKGIVVNKVFSRGREAVMDAFARRYGITARHALLGYAIRQPYVSSVLTGTTSRDHLKENIACIYSAKRLPYDELDD